jgi:SPP1 family predicted phage head-tail adaptor
MDAGILTERIEIQTDTGATKTANGRQHVESWETFNTVWAGVEQNNSVELTDSMQQQSTNSFNVVIRYDPTKIPTVNMKIIWGSRTLNIASVVIANNSKDAVYLQCVELHEE